MSNKNKRGRGRPLKKSKKSVNTGRKHVNIANASRSTIYRRARALGNSDFFNDVTVSIANRHAIKNAPPDNNMHEDIGHPEHDKSKRHSNETALAFYVEYDFDKAGYNGLVKDSRSRGCLIYPSYSLVQRAMDECLVEKKYYSDPSDVEIYVPLQKMLEKTAERLCESVALDWDEFDLLNLSLSATAGFDSSSGHTNTQQKCKNPENEQSSSLQSLFVTSFILIQLKSSESNKYSWINPTPQSVRFCRPLRLALQIEDTNATLQEFNRLNNEIRLLRPHKFKLSNGKSAKVSFTVTQTMFDGKCINTIVGNNATSRCPMCLRTTHQFGNLSDDFSVNDNSLQYGLGLLHDEIHAFEHLLHISYRIPFQTWDMKGEELKAQFKERKMYIQAKVFEKIGIRVDQVLQGHGTTNTGNLARRCFENPALLSEALEVDEELVSRIARVLSIFKCKKQLKLDKVEQFCWDTYVRHYQVYPWARMKPSVHKLLKHGCEIARMFPLPMAYYSEDANESWHKLYRENMTSHARQTSKEDRLADVFNRAVYSTDPKISLVYIQRRLKLHKKKLISDDILEFIVDSDVPQNESSEEEDICSEDE